MSAPRRGVHCQEASHPTVTGGALSLGYCWLHNRFRSDRPRWLRPSMATVEQSSDTASHRQVLKLLIDTSIPVTSLPHKGTTSTCIVRLRGDTGLRPYRKSDSIRRPIFGLGTSPNIGFYQMLFRRENSDHHCNKLVITMDVARSASYLRDSRRTTSYRPCRPCHPCRQRPDQPSLPSADRSPCTRW